MQKRSIYSLLLTSFILVFAISSVSAQQVLFGSQTVLRGQSGTIDITVNSPNPVGGLEIFFEVSTATNDAYLSSISITWDPDFDVLLHRYIDMTGVNYSSPDVIRMAALLANDTDSPLGAGQTVVAQFGFTANASCGGTVSVAGTTKDLVCGSCVTTAMTQFIDVDGLVKTPATLGGTIVTIKNADPTIQPIADALVHWGTYFSTTAHADDDDLDYGPEKLTFSLGAGKPDGMTINPTSGLIQWTPSALQMKAACAYPVEVIVTDSCGATASTNFTVYLWNDSPTITCPTEVNNIIWGYTASGSVTATDNVTPPDPGPSPLTYYVVSFNGPGGPGAIILNPATGAWSWPTVEDPAYLGDFTLCIGVTDGAAIGCGHGTNPNNADTCCLDIHVISTADIVIEKTHNTHQGEYEFVSVYVENTDMEMGGYDLLIAYDASALGLIAAEPGQFLQDCKWEYFEYRFGPFGNCGNGCPSGMVRLVAIAEINNGLHHPTCFAPPDFGRHELATLKFLVTDNRTFECQYVPIYFYWLDCGDNGVSSKTGDTLFVDRRVLNYDTSVEYVIWDEDDNVNYPETDRLPNVGAPDECLVNVPGKPVPVRAIDFWNGGVDIICADSIDLRGDINLNGLANEIADAVLFSNYFVYGLGVFTVNSAGQIAATDVNADGLTLSVADLVYQIRVIVGDALPYSKVASPVALNYYNNNGTLSVNTEMGAAFVVAQGNVVPELRAEQMELLYNYDGENTRILVWSQAGHSFSGEFLTVPSEIVSIEMATRDGAPAKLNEVPATFGLAQNYPNPFNPTTSITFSLPTASEYTLTIYNVTGQVVATFAGNGNIGDNTVVWDANDQASGIYFYRLNSETFSATKKMVLLK